ncbi:MAG TPA: NAD-dependent epimerase [Terriglobia bacterium]|jgi:UDP-glucuronate 4-epimerase|nr:NAD-dependent epimerase [Terriglobia bacterium]
MAKILVTGCAGFIGFHLTRQLRARGGEVVGLDSLNEYYDVNLKRARLALLHAEGGDHFRFVQMDLNDRAALESLFAGERFERVVHLAAQAGVRYSLTHPHAYAEANLTGFLNVLEGCRHSGVAHLLFASSSSVYGGNTRMPFSSRDPVDHPLSLYAATKKANELMAHSYAHLYRLPATGLRFFTVYGPWGRPDMALFIFTRAILEDRPIEIFNQGRMQRDFTYVADVVNAVVLLLDRIPEPDPEWSSDRPDSSSAPYRLYNIASHRPVELGAFVEILERKLGKPARKILLPMQPGDVPATYANLDELVRDTGYEPRTSIEEGVSRFVDWYREYYRV